MWSKLKEQFNLLKLEKKKLFLITNSDKFLSKDDFLDAIASALQGGVDIVLYREKELPDCVKVEVAHKIRALCDEYGATFIVNDRADIANIVEADGILLGQNDIKVEDAREILGQNAVIGKSCITTDEVIEAVNEGSDYVFFGPIYTNPAKVSESIDMADVRWVNKNIDIPVFITGEINLSNLNEIVKNDVEKIAITDAIMYAKIPEYTAREFLRYLP